MTSTRANTIIDNGWLQWATVGAEELQPHCGSITLKEPFYVLATQSCDLAHGSYENEPHAEFIGFSPIQELRPEFSKASNSRILHVEISESGQASYLGFFVRERFFLPREVLEKFAPNNPFVLSAQVCIQLTTWLSARYYRPSFSDEFNEHWKKVSGKIRDRIKKAYDRFGDIITGVFLGALDNPAEEEFTASWIVVFSSSKVDGGDQFKEVMAFFQSLENTLSDFLEKNDYDGTISVQSTKELTLSDLENHKRIFLDDMCFRGEELGGVEHQMEVC